MSHHIRLRSLFVGGLLAVLLAAAPQARADDLHVVIHVKTALSVDDAQICAVPNVAWATIAAGHRVTLLFDASGVTSVAKGFGLRGWFSAGTTAMDRAALPDRERRSLAKQFGVVPHNYGEYLRFLQEKGIEMYYNRTMALLYQIDPSRIDAAVKPLDLKAMARLLTTADRVIAY